MDRRNSHESTLSQRESVHNVFDDEYELDFDEDDFMVSDGLGFRQTHANADESGNGFRQTHANAEESRNGFRQTHANAEESRNGFRQTHANADEIRTGDAQDSDGSETPQRQHSTSKAPLTAGSDLRRTATRNSTAKVRTSMSMTQDSRPPGLSNRPSMAHSSLQHRDSVSSTASFATTSMSENPFETGPSHPYGMYPQHTMDRSNSLATASTGTQDRPMSIQRPAHPYALYSQTGLDDETPVQPMQPTQPMQPALSPSHTAMPVGFPGLNNGYRRVLGPDGEEQDIIGPDGHTEQLPPYSRYPDAGPTKASMAAEASASRIVPAPLDTAMDSDDPFHTPVSPASPIAEASYSAHVLPAALAEPLLPPVIPARLPPQRPETQTGNLAPVSSANTVPAAPSDSSSASLLSAELGESIDKYNEKDDPESAKTSWRKKRLFGRIPMGIVAIILFFLLVLAVVLGASAGTFAAKKNTTKDDNNAHTSEPEKEPQPQVTGAYPSGSLFGATPIPIPSGLPVLPTGTFSLPLGFPQEANPSCIVQANEYSAWSCKITFAPIIITINNTGVDSNGNQQQSASTQGGNGVPDNITLYGAQTPKLELQPMQLVRDLDVTTLGPAYHFSARYDKVVVLRADELTAGSSLKKRQLTDDASSRQRFTVQPGDSPWYCYWNQTYIEGYIYATDNSTAATLTALPTGYPTTLLSSFVSDTATVAIATPAPTSTTQTLPTGAPAVISTSIPITRRDATADAAASSSRIPPYPRIFKMEERRLPGSPQPYCQRMVLLDDGSITPAPNGNDPAVTLWLQEHDPSYSQYLASTTATAQSKRDIERRSDPVDSCHCQWMFK